MKKQFLLRLTILLTLLGCSRTSWAQLLVLDLIREWSIQAIRQLNGEIEEQQQQVLRAQWTQRSREISLHREKLALVAEEREAYMAMERRKREEQYQLRASLRNTLYFKSLVLRLEALGQKHRQIQAWAQGEPRLRPGQRQAIQSRLADLSARQAEAVMRFRWVEGQVGGKWTDEQRIRGIHGLHQQLDGLYRDFMVLEMEIRHAALRHQETYGAEKYRGGRYRSNGTDYSFQKDPGL